MRIKNSKFYMLLLIIRNISEIDPHILLYIIIKEMMESYNLLGFMTEFI